MPAFYSAGKHYPYLPRLFAIQISTIVQNQGNLCLQECRIMRDHELSSTGGILVWNSFFKTKSCGINRQINRTKIDSTLYKDSIDFYCLNWKFYLLLFLQCNSDIDYPELVWNSQVKDRVLHGSLLTSHIRHSLKCSHVPHNSDQLQIHGFPQPPQVQ